VCVPIEAIKSANDASLLLFVVIKNEYESRSISCNASLEALFIA
jgi:hypothetical protein